MILTRAAFDEYDSRIEKLSKAAYNAAYKRMVNYIEQFENASVAQTRDFAIETISAAVTAYGDAVSTCAADLYDEMAEASGVKLPSAALDTEDVSEYIDKEVRFQAGKLSDGNVSDFVAAIAKTAQTQTLRKANSTMMKNVKRDGLRYARVPMGGETCTFCVMLASRGFVYLSAKTAGEGTHYHNHCRCKVVPSFDKKGNVTTVEGYDPDELYTQWKKFEAIDKSTTIKSANKDAIKRVLNNNPSMSVAEAEVQWKKEAEKYSANIAATKTKEYSNNVESIFGDAGDKALKDMQQTLKKHDGDDYEIFFAYDITTGKRLAYVADNEKHREVFATPEFEKEVTKAMNAGHKVAFMHNHPGSSLPSAADLQTLASSNVDFGVIACHNGDIIKYLVKNKAIVEIDKDDLQLKINRIIDTYEDRGKSKEQLFEMLDNELGVEIEYFQFS